MLQCKGNMSPATRISILAAIASTSALAQPTPLPLERMPESLETRFALSAIPPHLRDAATVYLLDPAKGYVAARKGSRGVSCIVVRTDWQFPKEPFHDDIFWPVCYDAEGSKTLLQDYLLAAELRARGMTSPQVNQAVTKRFGTPAAPNPAHTGISYMIAPIMRGFIHSGVGTMNMPHYMFYAPGLTNKDIGGAGYGQYPFMLSMAPGRDDVIILLVGETEKARILEDSKDLQKDLCAYRTYLCTTAETKARTPLH